MVTIRPARPTDCRGIAEVQINSGYDAEILALHVRPAAQRNGIGRALWHMAVADLFELGAHSFMLWTLKNNPVRTWYERLQGKIIAEKTYLADGWKIEEVAYGWNFPIKE